MLRRLLALLVLLALATAPRAQLTEASALAAFDEAWETVRDSHWDKTLNGVDWEAVRTELRPKAAAAKSDAALRAVLDEMLGRLGQSHFAVIPDDALPRTSAPEDQSSGLGFDVRFVGDQLLVTRVEPGSAAQAAGVGLGWVVLRVGDLDAAALARQLHAAPTPLGTRRIAFQLWGAARGAILGPAGARRTVRFQDAQDKERELVLECKKRDVTRAGLGENMPTFWLEFTHATLERDGKKIGVAGFSNWVLPAVEKLDAALDSFAGFDGVILDLRGNTGGLATLTMGVAGHFFTKKARLGVMKTRESTVNIMAFPRLTSAAGADVFPFTGPVAILVDETTGSASEVFAGGMQSLGRARIFGSTSAGAVLPAMSVKLPNGDTLLHAVGDFETATGARLEGVGVVPDEPAPCTRAELLLGRDPALEAAVRWIASGAKAGAR